MGKIFYFNNLLQVSENKNTKHLTLLLYKQGLCNFKKFRSLHRAHHRIGRKHKKLRETEKLVFQKNC